jgi:hypothetical protein
VQGKPYSFEFIEYKYRWIMKIHAGNTCGYDRDPAAAKRDITAKEK